MRSSRPSAGTRRRTEWDTRGRVAAVAAAGIALAAGLAGAAAASVGEDEDCTLLARGLIAIGVPSLADGEGCAAP
ncbi:hypothetical protein [Demequina silvatica]|uniref:hypothetical protein n=1 Tax=Demequina silvatica TaxID=1638988 RepID=UPI000785D41E|nr:hypothetical protein [Demequina silvatica]